MMTDNLDMKKTDKALYNPPTKPVMVDVPPMHYLMIDGEGNPNTVPEYQTAIQTLYPLAYAVRAICKAKGQPFTVMPLEGLWWFETDAPPEGVKNYKDAFLWTMMIRMPDFVTQAMVDEAKATVAKKNPALPLDQVRYECYEEGPSAQIMHIGSYSEEEPTIRRLHAFMADGGYVHRSKHHEIYLSDARKTAPEKLKTVIRHPVSEA